MIIAPVARRAQPSEITRPPPIKGMNARDPINALEDGFALWLENLLPRNGGLELRAGKDRHRMLPGPILSLMAWAGTNRASRLFAATQSTITDVTMPGASTSPLVTGLAGGIWSAEMLSNAGGHWLMACNGANGVRLFDGAAWSTAAITGVDEATFTCLAVHMNRAFFVKRGSLDLYYLDPGAVQGEAKLLPLGGICRKGGTLVAVASMTTDGGRNANDQIAAVTSEGELVVYGGVSPHRAESWNLVGVFDVPPPVGRRCFLRTGGGLAYMSRKGLLPVPAVLAAAEKEKPAEAMTYVIAPLFEKAAAAAPADSHGWAAVESGHHELLVLNIPTQWGSTQFVQADGGAWCTLSGFGSNCWASLGDDLYFGDSSGTIWRYGGTREGPDYLASIGTGALTIAGGAPGMDAELTTGLVTSPIHALMIDGYSAMGSRARKGLKRVRPVLDMPASARFRFESVADHRRLPLSYVGGVTYADARRLWGSIAWDVGPLNWETRDVSATNQWRSIGGRGHALALVMAVKALAPMTYIGADVVYDTGGGI